MHKFLKSLCQSGNLTEAVKILFSTTSAAAAAGGSPIPPPTYSLVLQETINRQQFQLGKAIHAHLIHAGFTPGEYLHTKLLILHAKSGDMRAARHLFDELPDPNLFAYNAMISGFAHQGLDRHALKLYYSMRSSGLPPDPFTFSSVFHACAGLGSLDHGRRAHCLLIKTKTTKKKITNIVVVGTALIDMYCKSSSLDDARQVFDEMHERNVVTWTSLISGYGRHGKVRELIDLFNRMIEEGFSPNSVTFLSLLSACSHGGLLDPGWKYFVSMIEDHGIRATKEHYAAIVDMMGRAGELNEAYEFVRNSPFKEHSAIWGALIGACGIYGDAEMAEVAGKEFFEMRAGNVGKYVVVSNVFAASEMWEKADEVWRRIGRLGMRKETAWSSLVSGTSIVPCLR